jgi:hypothetical protein
MGPDAQRQDRNQEEKTGLAHQLLEPWRTSHSTLHDD